MNYLNTKVHYSNCRFCWMCRQVCTVATMTNNETQSPRSRGLAVHAVEKGIIDFDESFAAVMYKCSLCNYCNSWCEGDFDPQKFIIATRRDAVNMNIEPENVKLVMETIVKSGNIFSAAASYEFKKLWSALPNKGDVVVLAGGVIPFKAVEIAKAALSVFSKNGIRVAGFDEITGAYELYCLGYYDLAVEKAKKLVAQIKDTSGKTVVALDTQERYFLNNLEELLGIKLETKVVDFCEFVEDNHIAPTKAINKVVAYHDDSFLARKCEITELPRKIITSIAGTKLVEMLWFKEKAHATPTALYCAICPDIAGKMIKRRVDSFGETGAEIMIVSSASDYYNMKDAGIKVASLEEYLDQAL